MVTINQIAPHHHVTKMHKEMHDRDEAGVTWLTTPVTVLLKGAINVGPFIVRRPKVDVLLEMVEHGPWSVNLI